MSEDLVKRLRERGVCSLEDKFFRYAMVCDQVADRIEAAERIEALEAERDSAWNDALEAAAEFTESQRAWYFEPPWKKADHAAAIRAMKKERNDE